MIKRFSQGERREKEANQTTPVIFRAISTGDLISSQIPKNHHAMSVFTALLYLHTILVEKVKRLLQKKYWFRRNWGWSHTSQPGGRLIITTYPTSLPCLKYLCLLAWAKLPKTKTLRRIRSVFHIYHYIKSLIINQIMGKKCQINLDSDLQYGKIMQNYDIQAEHVVKDVCCVLCLNSSTWTSHQ